MLCKVLLYRMSSIMYKPLHAELWQSFIQESTLVLVNTTHKVHDVVGQDILVFQTGFEIEFWISITSKCHHSHSSLAHTPTHSLTRSHPLTHLPTHPLTHSLTQTRILQWMQKDENGFNDSRGHLQSIKLINHGGYIFQSCMHLYISALRMEWVYHATGM